MGMIIDSISAWVICVVFAATFGIYEFSVISVLVSLIFTCMYLIVPRSPWQPLILCAFIALCAFVPTFTPYLPVTACLCILEARSTFRWLWVLGWIIALARMGLDSVALLAICAACASVAWYSTSVLFAKEGAVIARDGIRESMLRMNHEQEQQGSYEHSEAQEEPEADPFEGLTERERQVAELVAQGFDNKQIASQLCLSEGTVRNNISTILAKKQLQNRTQLAILALTS